MPHYPKYTAARLEALAESGGALKRDKVKAV